MFSRSAALIDRHYRGANPKEVLRTHAAAVKPLASDSWLQPLPVDCGADPLKIAEHYSDTELTLQEIKIAAPNMTCSTHSCYGSRLIFIRVLCLAILSMCLKLPLVFLLH